MGPVIQLETEAFLFLNTHNMSFMCRAFRTPLWHPYLRSAALRTADSDYVTMTLDCLKFVAEIQVSCFAVFERKSDLKKLTGD